MNEDGRSDDAPDSRGLIGFIVKLKFKIRLPVSPLIRETDVKLISIRLIHSLSFSFFFVSWESDSPTNESKIPLHFEIRLNAGSEIYFTGKLDSQRSIRDIYERIAPFPIAFERGDRT